MALLCLSLVSSDAQTVTIDFENLASMDFITGNPVPTSAQLSDQLLTTHGVRFSSESTQPYVAVVSLGAGHATSGTNGIGGVDDGNLLSYFNGIRIQFFLPASPTTKATTDFVSIRGDTEPNGGWVRLDAFDANGTLLGSDVQNDGPPVTLSVSKPGIHSVLITEETGHVAFDDFAFNSPLAPASPQLTIEVSQVRLCWNSQTNKLYQVQYRTEFTTNQWVDLGAPVPGNATAKCMTDDVTVPRRFYRLVVLP